MHKKKGWERQKKGPSCIKHVRAVLDVLIVQTKGFSASRIRVNRRGLGSGASRILHGRTSSDAADSDTVRDHPSCREVRRRTGKRVCRLRRVRAVCATVCSWPRGGPAARAVRIWRRRSGVRRTTGRRWRFHRAASCRPSRNISGQHRTRHGRGAQPDSNSAGRRLR